MILAENYRGYITNQQQNCDGVLVAAKGYNNNKWVKLSKFIRKTHNHV